MTVVLCVWIDTYNGQLVEISWWQFLLHNCFCIGNACNASWSKICIAKLSTFKRLESSFACNMLASLDCPYAFLSKYLRNKDQLVRLKKSPFFFCSEEYCQCSRVFSKYLLAKQPMITYASLWLSLSNHIPPSYVFKWAIDDRFTILPSIPVFSAVVFILSRRRFVKKKCPESRTKLSF